MKGSTLEKKNSRIGWTMVIIASVLILAFSYIPMVQAFLLSLKTGKGNNLTFGGVANYVRMLNDTGFKTTIGNTLFYAVIQIPIMLLLALLVAVLLNSETLKLKGFYRTCIFLPCVTSPISYAILFKNIFATDGVVNHVLLSLGLINSPIAFIRYSIDINNMFNNIMRDIRLTNLSSFYLHCKIQISQYMKLPKLMVLISDSPSSRSQCRS